MNAPALRQLGRSGLRVSPICLGGNVFGWTIDEATSFKLLDAWVDAGLNFIDTADVYSIWVPGHTGGESETIIGKWLRQSGKRDRVVLATKLGKPMGEGKSGLSKAYVKSAVEASLRRLQTEVIDLYQSHDDDRKTPLEETLGAFAELIQEGKVRAIGASNHSAERLTEALDVSKANGLPRYESLQPLYNLVERRAYEDALEKVCVDHHVGVINFYALASGFLTGKYRSEADLGKSARGSGAGKYLNARGLAVLGALDAVAGTIGATAGQVALAWQMARPSITAPIASATSVAQLDELVAAARLVLDAPSIALIDRVSRESAA
jgi:aryl-alcohol dehydrogenase-like predicted oxidoreductase